VGLFAANFRATNIGERRSPHGRDHLRREHKRAKALADSLIKESVRQDVAGNDRLAKLTSNGGARKLRLSGKYSACTA
jgi:hypothetical protein